MVAAVLKYLSIVYSATVHSETSFFFSFSFFLLFSFIFIFWGHFLMRLCYIHTYIHGAPEGMRHWYRQYFKSHKQEMNEDTEKKRNR